MEVIRVTDELLDKVRQLCPASWVYETVDPGDGMIVNVDADQNAEVAAWFWTIVSRTTGSRYHHLVRG